MAVAEEEGEGRGRGCRRRRRQRQRRRLPPPQRRRRPLFGKCSSSSRAPPQRRGGETQRGRRAHACLCRCRRRRSSEPSRRREETHGLVLRNLKPLLSKNMALGRRRRRRSHTASFLSTPNTLFNTPLSPNVARRSHARGPRSGPRRRAGLRRVRARPGREAGRCVCVDLILFCFNCFRLARRVRFSLLSFFLLPFSPAPPFFKPRLPLFFLSLPKGLETQSLSRALRGQIGEQKRA